jgi:hypothetical protein
MLLGEPDTSQRAEWAAAETEEAKVADERRRGGGRSGGGGGSGNGQSGTWGGGLSSIGIDGKKALKKALKKAAGTTSNGSGPAVEEVDAGDEVEFEAEAEAAGDLSQIDVAAIMELARMQAWPCR